MIKGILDTNIVTAIFKGEPKCVQRYDEYLKHYGTIHFSVIVYYEINRGLLDLGSKKKLKLFKEFIESCTILDVNQLVVDKASDCYVKLKKEGNLIQDADILIAATALVHDMGVITANDQHFVRIEGLEVENWLK